MPKVLSMARNSHYLYRMTMLLALSLLASIVSHDVLVAHMLPVILNSAKDKVRMRTFSCACVGMHARVHVCVCGMYACVLFIFFTCMCVCVVLCLHCV